MTGLEQVAVVVVAVWLLTLTLVVLLLVRQVGLLTVRMSITLPHYDLDDLGPELGAPVPGELAASIGDGASPARNLLFFSATCSPCRDVAEGLRTMAFDVPTTALVAGEAKGARAFADLLPAGIAAYFDPLATEMAKSLDVRGVPYGVRIEKGLVTGKVYLSSAGDLGRLASLGRGAGDGQLSSSSATTR
jgi:hypothetical protein